jgi:hypothetical protein
MIKEKLNMKTNPFHTKSVSLRTTATAMLSISQLWLCSSGLAQTGGLFNTGVDDSGNYGSEG